MGTGFYDCNIRSIEIGNNVVAEWRAFWVQYATVDQIEEIKIGENFTSTGQWLEGRKVKKVILGANATLANNGLLAQYNTSIEEVIINGPIKKLGEFSLYKSTIHTPDGTLTIADGATIGNGAMKEIKGINKIKLGSNVTLRGGGYGCIFPKEDTLLECNNPITIKGQSQIGGYVILPSVLEYTGDSNVNQTFYYLKPGYNSTLTEIILNPGATITNLASYPKNVKITLKNISEWDSTLLENNKTVIQNYGLTNYEKIDGNGVFTKP